MKESFYFVLQMSGLLLVCTWLLGPPLRPPLRPPLGPTPGPPLGRGMLGPLILLAAMAEGENGKTISNTHAPCTRTRAHTRARVAVYGVGTSAGRGATGHRRKAATQRRKRARTSLLTLQKKQVRVSRSLCVGTERRVDEVDEVDEVPSAECKPANLRVAALDSEKQASERMCHTAGAKAGPAVPSHATRCCCC